MAEISKGKQHATNLKPSGLRHVEQVPDSDFEIPETQPDAFQTDLIELNSDDATFLALNQVKRSSQHLLLPETFGVDKPSSATIVNPAFSFEPTKLALNRTPPKQNAPASQPSDQPDDVVLSIDHDDSGAHKQDANITRSVSLSPPPAIEKDAAIVASKKEDAPLVLDRTPESLHKIPTPVENGDTGHISSFGPSVADIISQPTSKRNSKPASSTKATRSGRKAKKGRKLVVSGLLVPYPNPIAGSSQNHTSLERTVDAGDPIEGVGDLAVKPQEVRVCVPTDGPGDTQAQSSLMAEKRPRRDLIDIEDTVRLMPPGATQHSIFSKPTVQEPANIADRSSFAEEPSSYASYEGHVHPSKMQHAQDADAGGQGGLSLVCKSITQPPGTDSILRQVPRPTSSGYHSGTNQQISPYNLMADLDQGRALSPCSQDTHTSLHEASSRMGPTRVTKTQKKIRLLHKSYSRPSLAGTNYQPNSRVTAIEAALDSFRTACLVDQSRMEDQMASAVSLWKQEKMDLQKGLSEQQTAKTELSMENKTLKESLARLTEKARTIQKYVSGLQDDHERCQKLVVVSQKQNHQALQDAIADTVREKADLQTAFDQAVDSFRKSRYEMTKTINETYVQYKAALSRISDLEQQLTELTSMYEAEKCRSTESERKLVPSLQSMQRQMSESAVAFNDKLSRMNATLDRLASEDHSSSGVTDCLQSLQKLESTPFLTADDARKVERMLHSIYERMNAGFELMAKTLVNEPCLVGIIRQCMCDQTQRLLSEISRRDQAMSECYVAPHATELIKSELDTLKQTHQQTEAQIDLLRQSEAALKSHNVQLETERDGLRATLEEHQARARQSGLEMEQLQNERNQTQSDFLLANDTIKQAELRSLGREREFCLYRSQALAHFNGLEKQTQHMKAQLQAQVLASDTLKEDILGSKVRLESVQSSFDQLSNKVTHYKSMADTLRHERDRLDQEHGITQASLRSAEEKYWILEADKEVISGTLKETRTSLRESVNAGASSNLKCSDLQQQLDDLRDAKDASDEQLQKMQYNHSMELQQTEQDSIARIEDLQSRLGVSEDDRKDAHAKVRRMEAAHKQQLESHQQEASAKFEQLGSEAEQTRKKLETKHEQDLKCQQQRANAKIEELHRKIDELNARATINVLVPNSQPSFAQDAASNSLQQSQSGKTRKKVDRQTNSVTVVPSSSRRPGTEEDRSIIDRSNLSHSRQEDSEHQAGFFEEEYGNRFEPQVTLPEQENSLPLIEPDAEMVPETQDIEFAQGPTAQFAVIESQVPVGGDKNREKTGSDLSTMPSEDLSEMLLDLRSDLGRRCESSGYLPSPKNTMRTPERPGQETTSDPPSSTSQDRPKSRANTASRMAPMPVHDAQPQRVQAHDVAQDLAYVHSHRSSYNANPKRDHAQLVPMYAGTQPGGTDAGQKRKSAVEIEQGAPIKKLRIHVQPRGQRPSSTSRTYAPHTPAPTSTTSHTDVGYSPSSTTGRRSSNRSSSNAGSQNSAPRLSSTRNTRSKTANKYTDRFGQELDGH